MVSLKTTSTEVLPAEPLPAGAAPRIERADLAEQEKQEKKQQTETPLESLASICSVLAIGLFVMTFIFQNFEIPSASMEQTLLIGDHVLVDRVSFAPPTRWAPWVHYRDVRRGDVIVFLKPNPETPDLFLVKRAIGIPGDRIHLRNGIVYLNGVAQDEPQAGKPADDGNPYHTYMPFRDDFPSVAPTGSEGLTATWANELPSHIVGDDLVVPPGQNLCHGRQSYRVARRPLLGFRPAREHRRPPHVRLLVLQNASRPDRKAGHRRPHRLHDAHRVSHLRPDPLEPYLPRHPVAAERKSVTGRAFAPSVPRDRRRSFLYRPPRPAANDPQHPLVPSPANSAAPA